MRLNLEFRSALLDDAARTDELPRGERVARWIGNHLSEHGFTAIEIGDEDWGWYVKIANDAFPLWIGCGGYSEFDQGHLCFIEPKKPVVWRRFRRISTVITVERLATALQAIILHSSQASDLRWWTEQENARG